ncbi:unnamed protein product [Camellia sinensis]
MDRQTKKNPYGKNKADNQIELNILWKGLCTYIQGKATKKLTNIDQSKEVEEATNASRLLANLIVVGSGIMARALVQAYRQALANASRNGVTAEAVQNVRRVSKIMAEPEARQILGVTEHSSWEEILQKYDSLFERNAKTGSFYLQSKVHRAKECLEVAYQKQV